MSVSFKVPSLGSDGEKKEYQSDPSCPAGGSVAREMMQVQTGNNKTSHTEIKKTKRHSLKAPKVRVYDGA